jgi:hypothetical protein
MPFWFIPVVVFVAFVAVDIVVEEVTGEDLVQHGTNIIDGIAGTDLNGAYTNGIKNPIEDFFASLFGGGGGPPAVEDGSFASEFIAWLGGMFGGLGDMLHDAVDVLLGEIFIVQILVLVCLALVVFVLILMIAHIIASRRRHKHTMRKIAGAPKKGGRK